jgi:hypothetical protein
MSIYTSMIYDSENDDKTRTLLGSFSSFKSAVSYSDNFVTDYTDDIHLICGPNALSGYSLTEGDFNMVYCVRDRCGSLIVGVYETPLDVTYINADYDYFKTGSETFELERYGGHISSVFETNPLTKLVKLPLQAK